MTTAAENQNWQKRQYDSFGPHFRIETANPELGVCGNVAYNLYGYADSGDTSNLGLMGNGQFNIFADQCITIDGGAKVDGGGVCVNIIGSRGDIAITAMDNGDVRIKGRNICIDATNQLTLQANKIQIGHVQPGKTQDFQVTSTRVDLGKPKRGNMCKVLKTCATTLSFAKSLTPFSGGGIAGIAAGAVGGSVGGRVGAAAAKRFL